MYDLVFSLLCLGFRMLRFGFRPQDINCTSMGNTPHPLLMCMCVCVHVLCAWAWRMARDIVRELFCVQHLHDYTLETCMPIVVVPFHAWHPIWLPGTWQWFWICHWFWISWYSVKFGKVIALNFRLSASSIIGFQIMFSAHTWFGRWLVSHWLQISDVHRTNTDYGHRQLMRSVIPLPTPTFHAVFFGRFVVLSLVLW